MTTPPPGPGQPPGWHEPNAGYPQYPQYPQYGQPPPPTAYPLVPHNPGMAGNPPPYYPVAAPALFGVDPQTGLALSDKSKVTAGLLQLLPGFFLAVGGIGRLYAGNIGLGTAQLIATFVGWAAFWLAVCLSVFVLPLVLLVVLFGTWLWFVVDGIVMLAGHPVDGQGRPLRS